MSRPWIDIPPAAQPGQPHAFANREQQLHKLHSSCVSAGNAVVEGEPGIHRKVVVHGYKGVGKSALILQVLARLRHEETAATLTNLGDGQPQSQSPDQWIVMRLSGKQIGDPGALTDAVQQLAASAPRSEAPEERLLLRIGEEVRDTAKRAVPRARFPILSVISRFLFRQKPQQAHAIREALEAASVAIGYARQWLGATVHASEQRTEKNTLTTELRGQFKGGSDAAYELAAGLILQLGLSTEAKQSIERSWRIGAELVVRALNAFFERCAEAALPTVLVIDDFDELASAVGPDHTQRARVIGSLLGTLNLLRPTCLIIGLRQEYLDEDVKRQFQSIFVPPMTPVHFALALDAWSQAQPKPLDAAQTTELKQLASHLFASLPHEQPQVLPFPSLQIVADLYNDGAVAQTRADKLLKKYLDLTETPATIQAMEALSDRLTDDEVAAAAGTVAIELDEERLPRPQRDILTRVGYLRPELAGSDSPRILVDPLIAHLARARTAKP